MKFLISADVSHCIAFVGDENNDGEDCQDQARGNPFLRAANAANAAQPTHIAHNIHFVKSVGD